eukprot:g1293.t1
MLLEKIAALEKITFENKEALRAAKRDLETSLSSADQDFDGSLNNTEITRLAANLEVKSKDTASKTRTEAVARKKLRMSRRKLQDLRRKLYDDDPQSHISSEKLLENSKEPPPFDMQTELVDDDLKNNTPQKLRRSVDKLCQNLASTSEELRRKEEFALSSLTLEASRRNIVSTLNKEISAMRQQIQQYDLEREAYHNKSASLEASLNLLHAEYRKQLSSLALDYQRENSLLETKQHENELSLEQQLAEQESLQKRVEREHEATNRLNMEKLMSLQNLLKQNKERNREKISLLESDYTQEVATLQSHINEIRVGEASVEVLEQKLQLAKDAHEAATAVIIEKHEIIKDRLEVDFAREVEDLRMKNGRYAQDQIRALNIEKDRHCREKEKMEDMWHREKQKIENEYKMENERLSRELENKWLNQEDKMSRDFDETLIYREKELLNELIWKKKEIFDFQKELSQETFSKEILCNELATKESSLLDQLSFAEKEVQEQKLKIITTNKEHDIILENRLSLMSVNHEKYIENLKCLQREKLNSLEMTKSTTAEREILKLAEEQECYKDRLQSVLNELEHASVASKKEIVEVMEELSQEQKVSTEAAAQLEQVREEQIKKLRIDAIHARDEQVCAMEKMKRDLANEKEENRQIRLHTSREIMESCREQHLAEVNELKKGHDLAIETLSQKHFTMVQTIQEEYAKSLNALALEVSHTNERSEAQLLEAEEELFKRKTKMNTAHAEETLMLQNEADKVAAAGRTEVEVANALVELQTKQMELREKEREKHIIEIEKLRSKAMTSERKLRFEIDKLRLGYNEESNAMLEMRARMEKAESKAAWIQEEMEEKYQAEVERLMSTNEEVTKRNQRALKKSAQYWRDAKVLKDQMDDENNHLAALIADTSKIRNERNDAVARTMELETYLRRYKEIEASQSNANKRIEAVVSELLTELDQERHEKQFILAQKEGLEGKLATRDEKIVQMATLITVNKDGFDAEAKRLQNALDAEREKLIALVELKQKELDAKARDLDIDVAEKENQTMKISFLKEELSDMKETIESYQYKVSSLDEQLEACEESKNKQLHDYKTTTEFLEAQLQSYRDNISSREKASENFQNSLTTLENEKAILTKKLEEFQNRYTGMGTENVHMRQRIESSRQELEELDTMRLNAQMKAIELGKQVSLMEGKLQLEKNAHLETRTLMEAGNEETLGKIKNLKKRLMAAETVNQELALLKSTNDEIFLDLQRQRVACRVAENSVASHVEQLSQWKATCESAENSVASHVDQLSQWKAKFNRLELHCQNLENTASTSSQSLSNLEHSFTTYREEKEAHIAKLTAAVKFAEANATRTDEAYATLQDQMKVQARSNLDKFLSRNNEIRAERDSIALKLCETEQNVASMNAEIAKIRAKLLERENKLRVLENESLSVKKEAISTGKLRNELNATRERLQIADAKTKAMEKALLTMQKAEIDAAFSERECEMVECRLQQTQLELREVSEKNVLLENELGHLAITTKHAAESEREKNLSLLRERENLEQLSARRIASVKRSCVKLKEELARKNEKIQALLGDREKVELEVEDYKQRIETEGKCVNDLFAEIGNLKEKNTSLLTESGLLQRNYRKALERVKMSDTTCEALRTQAVDLGQKMIEVEREKADLVGAKASLLSVKAELSAAQSEISLLQRQERNNKRLQEKLEESTKGANRLAKQLKRTKIECQNREKEKNEILRLFAEQSASLSTFKRETIEAKNAEARLRLLLQRSTTALREKEAQTSHILSRARSMLEGAIPEEEIVSFESFQNGMD